VRGEVVVTQDFKDLKHKATGCDDPLVFTVGAVFGAALTVVILVLTKPEAYPSQLAAQSALRSAEREALACVRTLETTQKSADFWREQAMAMRTDGVDSLTPYKEGKR
jgi:hypothetical protein